MTGTGEKQGDRAAMERVADRMISSGVKPEKAIEAARESMQRVDKRQRDGRD